MSVYQEPTTIENVAIGSCVRPTNVLVNHLLDSVCPKSECSDVDRAILVASLGG